MERVFIGSGHEHIVFKGQNPDYVYKTPTLLNQAMFWIFNFDPRIINGEYKEIEDQLKNSNIKFPEWRVLAFPNGLESKRKPRLLWRFLSKKTYVVRQKWIEEDNSISDVRNIIKSETPELIHRYDTNPTNFISHENSVYYIDPTKSVSLSGILDRLGILSKKRYRLIRDKIFKTLPFLKESD
ncbi:MAG: hypothetical protein ACD_30C00055G0001 [uncultured bacterium]|uniref:Uncharacterized protein n=4 Tax=Candidatus Daviesiibacteriota TaxID=1752718 RepID=A0A0G0H5V3_9BACT|nr:MAG: hypothetical protein ACD_30C00055G0001 [uncultured bacterium]KKQ07459.1 MAG: hypothetical protein US19_C0045G0001 [Candidatus Daviesbacteria bacterium GW2011_GWB1_36_5]KKQ14739.1 MAG: hypothetical protein US28_C0031G0022 [Candidatus Daviesbacteria bacterium GW2011_GWA1_36_8]OGE17069.1 MAG: hypothetical protein A2858_01555 [Candidatus Daviesbacteria bacterium RIFCSPHIGHO2_01_FULL_36_37]OGE32701.1 MAG: hypothetical protein A3C99_03260 [Candidatus Daviesbacteria bacterium RIFCSPHIGHO2_02_F